MSYVTYAFDSFTYIATKIYIPIPITANYVAKFNIISILFALFIIGLLIYFFGRLFGIEISRLFRDTSSYLFGHSKADTFGSNNSKIQKENHDNLEKIEKNIRAK